MTPLFATAQVRSNTRTTRVCRQAGNDGAHFGCTGGAEKDDCTTFAIDDKQASEQAMALAKTVHDVRNTHLPQHFAAPC